MGKSITSAASKLSARTAYAGRGYVTLLNKGERVNGMTVVSRNGNGKTGALKARKAAGSALSQKPKK